MGYFPHLVILRLLNLLSFKDLLSARTVSWDFNFCVVETLSSLLYFVSLQTQRRLSEFLRVFSNCIHPIPFSRFILNPSVGSEEDINHFCQLYAEEMVELCIDARVQEKLLLPYAQYEYEAAVPRYNDTLPNYLNFVLKNSLCLEVLQIKRDGSDFSSDSMLDFPGVPHLPKLIILEIPNNFRR